MNKYIPIKEYLIRKGIAFKEKNGELIAHCVFHDCDKDSGENEGHLYFNVETSEYLCHKCGDKGNIVTLAKFLGDDIKDILLNPRVFTNNPKFDINLVEKCHRALPDRIRSYLNGRGIDDNLINDFKLGWGEFYGKWWITIPIKDINGKHIYFKLRQNPDVGDEKITYPKGVKAQIYGWDTLRSATNRTLIVEGEFDRLIALSNGIPAITSTHGAGTFKQEWINMINKDREVGICYDNDKPGRDGAKRVAEMAWRNGNMTYIITLPNEVGEGGDITDYFVKLNGAPDDLFGKYAKEYPEKIDMFMFREIYSKDLIEILGQTIKHDNGIKLIVFYSMLLIYTEDLQINNMLSGPSSCGKSYLTKEVAYYFPDEDVIWLSYTSPTALFHQGYYDKELNVYVVDLHRKIIVFRDQPHPKLLENLRPLLSQDNKDIELRITDKTLTQGLKTKIILLKGYPSVIYCTASGRIIDEQEATRFVLLSPATDQNKLRDVLHVTIEREVDADSYKKQTDNDPDRKLLKERIVAIKQANINNIIIDERDKQIIEGRIIKKCRKLKPRHARDVKRLISFIKASALLNFMFREKRGTSIVANQKDIDEAFQIWGYIFEAQDLNLPPKVFDVYQYVLVPLWEEKNMYQFRTSKENTVAKGLTLEEINKKYYDVFGTYLQDWELRQSIIPPLKAAGKIRTECDPDDNRKILIFLILENNE
jgi:hypothetical protein